MLRLSRLFPRRRSSANPADYKHELDLNRRHVSFYSYL